MRVDGMRTGGASPSSVDTGVTDPRRARAICSARSTAGLTSVGADDGRDLVRAQEQLEVAHQRRDRARALTSASSMSGTSRSICAASAAAALAHAPDAFLRPVQRRQQRRERVGDFVGRPVPAGWRVANRSRRASDLRGHRCARGARRARRPFSWSCVLVLRDERGQSHFLFLLHCDSTTAERSSKRTYQPKHQPKHRSTALRLPRQLFARRASSHEIRLVAARDRPPHAARALRAAVSVLVRVLRAITPQRLSRERSVFGCSPSRRAAPRSPSITQRVSVSTCSTYQRSTSAMVAAPALSRAPPWRDLHRRRATRTDRAGRRGRARRGARRSTARSITFCSSRTLPGQL